MEKHGCRGTGHFPDSCEDSPPSCTPTSVFFLTLKPNYRHANHLKPVVFLVRLDSLAAIWKDIFGQWAARLETYK
ncbi:hypothetical protein SAMN04487945_3094 [Halobacterium jilantaiense]|uniref:Uncharacterized protein n=1 Tax=Halobacterium jilantaiense TaxID=355548 RepID=A0A1I0R3D3_9EURY|nr:hypothetical protein SAMN04487945_3094 [Halobacterium jilantaiense]